MSISPPVTDPTKRSGSMPDRSLPETRHDDHLVTSTLGEPAESRFEQASHGTSRIAFSVASSSPTSNGRSGEYKVAHDSGERIGKKHLAVLKDIPCTDENPNMQVGSDNESLPVLDVMDVLQDLKKELGNSKCTISLLKKSFNEERGRTFSMIQEDLEEQERERGNLEARIQEKFANTRKEMDEIFKRRLVCKNTRHVVANDGISQTDFTPGAIQENQVKDRPNHSKGGTPKTE